CRPMSTPDAGPTPDDLEADERAALAADVERARARVAESLSTLGEEVARRGDWRAWVRARPGLFAVGALALGFLAGGGGRRLRGP
ncbi:MAG TPA: hypothetical protein VHL80_06600, partial [Polyangia bacterium]|nr:hypothetical protein [Polyangia bacterium]